MSPVMHELPHALIASVPVRNWRRESALAERAAVSIAASISFFAMVCSLRTPLVSPEVNRNAGCGFPGRFCAEKFASKAILELQLSCC